MWAPIECSCISIFLTSLNQLIDQFNKLNQFNWFSKDRYDQLLILSVTKIADSSVHLYLRPSLSWALRSATLKERSPDVLHQNTSYVEKSSSGLERTLKIMWCTISCTTDLLLWMTLLQPHLKNWLTEPPFCFFKADLTQAEPNALMTLLQLPTGVLTGHAFFCFTEIQSQQSSYLCYSWALRSFQQQPMLQVEDI